MDWIYNIDFAILDWIHNNITCAFLDTVMPFITKCGNKGMIWLAVAVVMLCTKKYRRQGAVLIISLALGVLIGNMTLKPLIERPRPCWINAEIDMIISIPHDYSFPSGHTLSSTIAATVITMSNRKFGYGAIPVAALIAFSRLYLYVHFPTDILGGIALGLVIGGGVFKISEAVQKKVENMREENDCKE